MSPAWMTDAACAEDGRDLWYAEDSERRQLKEAKRICDEVCTVKDQCLAYAMALEAANERTSLRYGIWGSATPNQRHKLAGRRK